MNKKSKTEQFITFIKKIKKEKIIISIDMSYGIEFMGRYEDIDGNLLEGVSERLLSDDGRSYVEVKWSYENRTIYVTQSEFYQNEETGEEGEYPEESLCSWELDYEIDEFVESFGLDFSKEIEKFINKELK